MFREQRKFPRYDVEFEVEYAYSDSTCSLFDRSATKNISRGGVSFLVHNIVRPGSLINVEMKIPGQKKILAALCKLVWKKDCDDIGHKKLGGLKILQMRTTDRHKLNDYICRLSNTV